MKCSVSVRQGGWRDLAEVKAFLDRELRVDYFVREGQLRTMLMGIRHEVYLAEVDGRLAGVVVLSRRRRIVNLLVGKEWRRRGVGRLLVGLCGAESVRAKVDVEAGDPRQWYAGLGFEETGEWSRSGRVCLMVRRQVVRVSG